MLAEIIMGTKSYVVDIPSRNITSEFEKVEVGHKEVGKKKRVRSKKNKQVKAEDDKDLKLAGPKRINGPSTS